MKKKIKIYFTDFWDTFKLEDNYFVNLLKNDFDIELDPVNPDYLFYSVFGINHIRYRCTRIFFTGENYRPNFEDCDWAFSFDYDNNPKHYRLPLYALFANMDDLVKQRNPEVYLKNKSEFACFIYSNAGASKRKEFLFKLAKYKHVHSAGRFLNNIGGPIPGFEKEKRDYIKKFKFTFAFENSSYPGYTTEKILDPLLCGSVPLYWGNTLVGNDFNPKSFLNYHDFSSDEEFIDQIIRYDNDLNLYMEMLSEPPFTNNQINEFVCKHNVLNRFKFIFDQDIEPIALSNPDCSNRNVVTNSRFRLRKAKFDSQIIKKKLVDFSVNKLLVKKYRFFEHKK